MPDAIVGGSAVAILTNLYDLRDLGLIDAGVAARIETALGSGNSAVIARAVDDLEATEADAAYLGLDADVNALRSALAASVGYAIPRPIAFNAATGAALPGTLDERQRAAGRSGVGMYILPSYHGFLTVEDEYRDPNLLMGAEEALLYDRFGNPLDARVIVGHSSTTSGNVGASPEQIQRMLELLKVPVAPSRAYEFGDPLYGLAAADGRLLTDEEMAEMWDVIGEPSFNPDTYGITTGGYPPTGVIYARSLDEPHGGRYVEGDRDRVISHEAGHVLYGLLPKESRLRLRTDEATLQAVWDENNMAPPVGDHDTVIDEYLGEAFRAYLTDPDWFKVHFPALADAIAREVNAAPRLQGFVQFN